MRRSSKVMAALLLSLTGCAGGAQEPDGGPAPEAQPVAAEAPLSDERVIELGQRYADLVYAGDIEALWQHFDPEMKAEVGSADAFAGTIDQIFAQTGPETMIVDEEVVDPRSEDIRVYQRRARYANMGGMDAYLIIALRPDGSIAGLFVRPAQ